MRNPNANYQQLAKWQNGLRRQRYQDLNPPFWLLPLIVNKAQHDQTTEDHLRTMSIVEGTGLAWYNSDTNEQDTR